MLWFPCVTLLHFIKNNLTINKNVTQKEVGITVALVEFKHLDL